MTDTISSWCTDRTEFDIRINSLLERGLTQKFISKCSGLSPQVIRECGSGTPIHKASIAKLNACWNELDRIANLDGREKALAVDCGYVDRTWFDQTVADLMRHGLTITCISEVSGIAPSVFAKCSTDTRLVADVNIKLAHALDDLKHIIELDEPYKSYRLGIIHYLVCPTCKRRFKPKSEHQTHCSDTCAQIRTSYDVPVDHISDYGEPSATSYRKGCRCIACAEAQRALAKDKRRRVLEGKDIWAHAADARAIIIAELTRGYTIVELSRLTGIQANALRAIRDGKTRRVKPDTLRALEQIAHTSKRAPKANSLIPAEPLRKHLAIWKGKGLTYAFIAKKSDVSVKVISNVNTGATRYITFANLAKIMRYQEFFDEVAGLPHDEQQLEMHPEPAIKRCAVCGKRFRARNPKRIFCSTDCKRLAHHPKTSHDPDYAQRILADCKRKRISLKALAEGSGLTPDALYNIAKGKNIYITDATYTKLKPILKAAWQAGARPDKEASA